MNQTPTRTKSRQEVNPYMNKVGLMNQTPSYRVYSEKSITLTKSIYHTN